MADIGHVFGQDLVWGVTGDLQCVTGIPLCNQRIVRRLCTNALDYIWQPEYGEGLPKRIGDDYTVEEDRAIIQGGMFQELSVQQDPPPYIGITDIGDGLAIQISYIENDSGQPAALSFEVTP